MAATAVRSTIVIVIVIVIVIATMIWLAPLHRAWAVPPPTLDGPPITTSITRVRPARGLVVPTLAPTRTGVTLGVAGQF
jgi:hypothetical protein